jgi:hypothetical protein
VSRALSLAVILAGALLGAGMARGAQQVQAVLPPLEPWQGRSLELALPADHPWATPFERSGMARTPSYDETVAWLERLVAAAPELEMVSLGASPEGREIWMVIASREGAATPEALHAVGRPLLLAQGGIHAGEIDGKDAGMMLLRDLTVGKRLAGLLDRVSLLFVPILSVDGHERSSPWGRINQRGPAETGWRTNARNLNLNRDYAKLDTPEVRAIVAAIGRWRPDLYLDVHVTDGMDFQYDITWGFNGRHGWSPAIAGWLAERLKPAVDRALRVMGHVPGPLFFPLDDEDQTRGVLEWTGSPRYSNGYGDARHLATVLVENHSLKPYRRRVLGTRVLLESVLESLGEHGAELWRATAADRAARPASLTLSWKVAGEPGRMSLAAIEQRPVESVVTGGPVAQWTGKPVTLDVPLAVMSEPAATVAAPAAYWIPPGWPEVVERLAAHGIQLERIEEERRLEVEVYRVAGAELASEPFEGHIRVTAAPTLERRRQRFAAGSVRVGLDQPLGLLAALLLEPASPDSFFQWGFFLEILQRAEYAEAYVMAPTAEGMLEADPKLAAEFRSALEADEELAADPAGRLEWFYSRTPWFDERWNLYPVARELSPRR